MQLAEAFLCVCHKNTIIFDRKDNERRDRIYAQIFEKNVALIV